MTSVPLTEDSVCEEWCLWPSSDVSLVYLWCLILLNFCCNWLQQSSWITKGIGSPLPQFIAVIVYRSINLFFRPTSLAMHVFFSFFLSFIACIYQYCSSSLFLINISLWNPLRFSFFLASESLMLWTGSRYIYLKENKKTPLVSWILRCLLGLKEGELNLQVHWGSRTKSNQSAQRGSSPAPECRGGLPQGPTDTGTKRFSDWGCMGGWGQRR